MDLKHLRTFATVAEQGSVSKAALRLRIAQPALSRQIINLEQELGVQLFERVGRGLLLTREGEQLLDSCRSVLGHVSLLTEEADRLRDGNSGVLKVAASPQIIESVLSTFLRRYAISFPNVQIKLTEAIGRDQLVMLERGEIDVSIGLLRAVETDEHLASYELPALGILAAYHPSITLGHRATVDIVKLAKYPLLLPDSTYVFRKSFDAACRLAGLEPKIVIESRASHTLLALAEARHGVAIIQTAVPTDRYRLRIAQITYHRKPIRVPMAAIWDKRRALPQYAKEFNRLLAQHMRKALPIARPLGNRQVVRAD